MSGLNLSLPITAFGENLAKSAKFLSLYISTLRQAQSGASLNVSEEMNEE